MGYGFEVLSEWIGAIGWGQLVNAGGLFAAAAGIALTLAQLGLFRRQLKLDALIKIMDSNREIVTLSFEHPAVWSAIEKETGTVTAEEAPARRRYLQLWTNHMQIMWTAWQLGLVSGREWQAYRQDLASSSPARPSRSTGRAWPGSTRRDFSDWSSSWLELRKRVGKRESRGD